MVSTHLVTHKTPKIIRAFFPCFGRDPDLIISFDEASMQTRISFLGKVIFVFLAFSYFPDDEASSCSEPKS